jgi:hypothetical protein
MLLGEVVRGDLSVQEVNSETGESNEGGILQ